MPATNATAVPRQTTTQVLMVPANGAGVMGSAAAGGVPENVIDASGNVTTVSVTDAVVVIAAVANGVVVVILASVGGNGVEMVSAVMFVLSNDWVAWAELDNRGLVPVEVWLGRLVVLSILLSDGIVGCREVLTVFEVLLLEDADVCVL